MTLKIPTPLESTNDCVQFWGWDEHSALPVSAYVHIPFCRHRCGYCNFSLLANRDDLIDRFLNALEVELSKLEIPRQVETLFLGGGTPSILPQDRMDRLLTLLNHWLPLSSQGEWTIEANPLDISDSFCEHICSRGINRISIGGQSFQPTKLLRLERDHSPEELIESVERSHKFFSSVSLDLIFGAPNETFSGWQTDLKTAIELGVHHLSTYGLTFEKGSRFWGMRERHEIESIPEELELAMYEEAIDRLSRAGLEHYEISNFAKPSHRCRHNQSYWLGESWWAFGPSAARFVGGTRSVNHRSTLEYIRRIEQNRSTIHEMEKLSNEQRVREKFVFGMRQMEGVNWTAMRLEAEPSVATAIDAAIEKHIAGGWMIRDRERIRLTRAGLFVSDALWGDYL